MILNMSFWQVIFSLRKKNWREKIVAHTILHVRNEYAIKEVDIKMNVSHIILLWGAGHLPGMEKLLIIRGFKKTSIKWIPAFTKK